MPVSFGNTSIGEMYYGGTKIACAYCGNTLIYGEPPTPTPQPPTTGSMFLAYSYQSTTSWWYSTNGTTYQACPSISITTGALGSYGIRKINDKLVYITSSDATVESLYIYPYYLNITGGTATKLNGIAVEAANMVLSLMNVSGILYLAINYIDTSLAKTDILISSNEGVSWTKIYTSTNNVGFYHSNGIGNFIRTKTGTYFYGYNRTTKTGTRLYISNDYSSIIETTDSGDGSVAPPITDNRDIFFMNGRYYSKCSNYIYITSEEDNFVWTKYDFVIGEVSTAGGYICSNYNNIAVYTNSTNSTRNIWYSYDGLNWIQVTSVPGSGGTDGYITYGNGKFSIVYYCAGSGAKSTSNSVYSADGINWYTATTPNSTNYVQSLGCF